MEEADLVPGDVIFFENNYRQLDGTHSHDYIDHVGIFAGFDKNSIPLIIHSITTEKGYYYPYKPSGLCQTSLRTLANQIQSEEGYPDLKYDVTYKVFRFKNPDIRKKALEIIRKQAQYRIPYDEKRLNEKLAREDSLTNPLDADGFNELGKSLYREVGIYRSIKYAARHPKPLTRTRFDGVGRGLTCSMAVILAFQIAELLLDNKINTHCSDSWASDKYAAISSEKSYPDSYMRYLSQLSANKDSREIETDLNVSYDFWQDEHVSPEEYTHTSFAVDAKTIGAAGLFVNMLENDGVWEFKNVLHTVTRTFSPAEKQVYKKQSQLDFFVSLNDLSISARFSPARSETSLEGYFFNRGSELDRINESPIAKPWATKLVESFDEQDDQFSRTNGTLV